MKNEEKYTQDEKKIINFFVQTILSEELPINKLFNTEIKKIAEENGEENN